MGTFETAAMAVLGAVQSRRQYRAQNTVLVGRQQAEAQKLDLARRISERDKRRRLAALQATQRARFGAAGIGPGGSADAVLNGLAEETEQSIRDDRLGIEQRLDQSAGATSRARRINLFDYRKKQPGYLKNLARGLSLLEP